MSQNRHKKLLLGSSIAGLIILAIAIVTFLLTQMPKSTTATKTKQRLTSTSSSSKKSTVPSSSKILLPNFEQLLGNRVESQPLPVTGAITIPELGINLPIFTGSDDTQITFGAGTVGENQKMGTGNYSLASHHVFYLQGSENELFSPLTKAKTGMIIYTTDKNFIYTYKINKIFQVDSSDISVLESGVEPIITLIYCLDYGGPIRVIVRGTLEQKTAFQKTTKVIQDKFIAPWNQIPASELPAVGY